VLDCVALVRASGRSRPLVVAPSAPAERRPARLLQKSRSSNDRYKCSHLMRQKARRFRDERQDGPRWDTQTRKNRRPSQLRTPFGRSHTRRNAHARCFDIYPARCSRPMAKQRHVTDRETISGGPIERPPLPIRRTGASTQNAAIATTKLVSRGPNRIRRPKHAGSHQVTWRHIKKGVGQRGQV